VGPFDKSDAVTLGLHNRRTLPPADHSGWTKGQIQCLILCLACFAFLILAKLYEEYAPTPANAVTYDLVKGNKVSGRFRVSCPPFDGKASTGLLQLDVDLQSQGSALPPGLQLQRDLVGAGFSGIPTKSGRWEVSLAATCEYNFGTTMYSNTPPWRSKAYFRVYER